MVRSPCLPSSGLELTDTCQSLKIEALSAAVSFDNARTSGRWIVGSGQAVYWRSCFIWVYTSDQVDEPVKKHGTCNGQAVIPVGIEVYVGGIGGKVKY
jgi:hypothetical protein